jgi:hypothetical protein
VPGAVGSKAWPENVSQPSKYRIEKAGPPGKRHLSALIHKETGERRERPAKTAL